MWNCCSRPTNDDNTKHGSGIQKFVHIRKYLKCTNFHTEKKMQYTLTDNLNNWQSTQKSINQTLAIQSPVYETLCYSYIPVVIFSEAQQQTQLTSSWHPQIKLSHKGPAGRMFYSRPSNLCRLVVFVPCPVQSFESCSSCSAQNKKTTCSGSYSWNLNP